MNSSANWVLVCESNYKITNVIDRLRYSVFYRPFLVLLEGVCFTLCIASSLDCMSDNTDWYRNYEEVLEVQGVREPEELELEMIEELQEHKLHEYSPT